MFPLSEQDSWPISLTSSLPVTPRALLSRPKGEAFLSPKPGSGILSLGPGPGRPTSSVGIAYSTVCLAQAPEAPAGRTTGMCPYLWCHRLMQHLPCSH